MIDGVKERITLVICGTVILALIILFAWYVYASNSPTIYLMRLEMDNNTLEAVKLINMNITN